MNNKKKKKGFTLIELIAVIAILAILGVILVPKISGYSAKASRSKDLANAKMLIQALEMYNGEHPDTIIKDGDEGTDKVGTNTATSLTTGSGLFASYVSSWPKDPVTDQGGVTHKSWYSMTYTELRAYAAALE
jgi:type IV pilus assembly protein PilA